MEFLNVIVATIASFAVGAVYYMSLAKPWVEASGVPVDEDGKPSNGSSAAPYIIGLFLQLLVAGMMRHVFELSGIDTVGKGLVSGLGIGLFFITPWIFLNIGYSMRPYKLGFIDGGYAVLACGVMGVVLTLF